MISMTSTGCCAGDVLDSERARRDAETVLAAIACRLLWVSYGAPRSSGSKYRFSPGSDSGIGHGRFLEITSPAMARRLARHSPYNGNTSTATVKAMIVPEIGRVK